MLKPSAKARCPLRRSSAQWASSLLFIRAVAAARAAQRAAARLRPRLGPLDRLFQVGLVDVGADEVHAEPRARDRRAAEAGERIHRDLDPRQAVQAQALLRQPRREGRRMRPIAIAPLDRLVGNEPGVAAAADALGRAAPAADVRLILIGHAERQPVERGRRRCGVK